MFCHVSEACRLRVVCELIFPCTKCSENLAIASSKSHANRSIRCYTLVATQASALSTGVPRGSLADSAGPAATAASLSLLSYVLSSSVSTVCRAERALGRCTGSRCKPLGDERRCVDEFASSTVLRPDLGQELIQMCCNEASSLVQGGNGRSHDECHGEHSVRKVLGGERDDKVAELPVGVLLRIGIRECQREGAQEEDAVHANAHGDLKRCQFRFRNDQTQH